LGHRIVNWIFLNIIFALIPLLASIFIRLLFDKLTVEEIAKNSEILFLTTMGCSSALRDLYVSGLTKKEDKVYSAVFWVLFIGAVWTTLLYAVFIVLGMISNQTAQVKLFNYSIVFAVLFLLVSIFAEILIGLEEKKILSQKQLASTQQNQQAIP
jgi:drug/metabolite transporter (DMT)-like permease